MTGGPSDLILPASQVSEVIQSLVKALRAFQMYLPNNPMYQRAGQNVRAGFAPIWHALDDLVLQVAETDFMWEEQPVYHQITKNESLAWTLYKDGMRVLSLKKGVEEEEIVRFLEVVNRARFMQQDAGDDLLTLLWEQEFNFIQYRFVEGFGDEVVPEAAGDMGGNTSVTAEQVQQQVREEAPPKPAGIVDLEEFDSTLYFLDENEIATVAEQLRQEYQRDARASALAAVYDIFEFEPDRAVREEIIGVLETLLPNLLNAGEFRAVASVMRDVRELVRKASHLSTEMRDRLLAFESKLSEPEIVRQLMVSLDGAASQAGDEDVTEVLRELHPAALGAIITWLPTLNNAHVRELLEQAADRIASSSPTEVLRLLRDPGNIAVKEIVELCGRLKLQAAVPGLGETVRSPDPAVRLASVQALSEVASPGALTAMESAIDDDDRAVRLAAVRAMGARGIRNALKRVEPVILGKSDRDLDLTEKMAFFEAYGAIAGPTAIPTLQSMLLTRGLLGYKASPETRACAAVALGRIRTPEARAVLQKVADDKELVVRNAVSRALRGQPAI
jgi:HEAT repeat protein